MFEVVFLSNRLKKWSCLIAKHGNILEGLNDLTKSSILQVAVKLDPAMITIFSNFLSLRKLQGKDEDDIPYEELFDQVQSNFVTLDRIQPLPLANCSINMEASHDVDDPSDDDRVNFLINHGVSDTVVSAFCNTFATNPTLTANVACRDCQRQP